MVQVSCNGKPIQMEIDTGASCTLMGKNDFENLQNSMAESIHLAPNEKPVRTYTKEIIKTLGTFQGHFTYKGQSVTNSVLVVDHQGPILMGRDLLGKLKLDWQAVMASQVHVVISNNSPNPVKDYPKLFEPGLGKLEGVKAKIRVNEGAVPIYQKARPILFIERELVEDELSRLENLDVIEPVQFSEWASQIVPVRKVSGNFR